MRLRGGQYATVFAFAWLALAQPAHAGPVEQLVQVALHPSAPNTMAVRYYWGGEGLLVTHDGGASFQLLCTSAILSDAKKGAKDPSLFDPIATHLKQVGMASDGTLLVGVYSGLLHDDQRACAWQVEPTLEGSSVTAFAFDPHDPAITYAVTATVVDGKPAPNGLLRRGADGVWSDFGAKAEVYLTGLVAVANGSATRFYALAVVGQTPPDDAGMSLPIYAVRSSDDGGATWTQTVFGAAPELVLQGVDPTNPDRVVVSIDVAEDAAPSPDDTLDTVLVSDDRGKSFKPYMKLSEIRGVAFAPDGRVWLGDLGGETGDATRPMGLYFAPSLDVPATRLSNASYPVQCLAYQPATDTLFACQHFWFGPVDTSEGTFTTKLNLAEVAAQVQCDGEDVAAACTSQLCGAYCGMGHFAKSGACSVYHTPACGPLADSFGTMSGSARDAGPDAAVMHAVDAGTARGSSAGPDAGTSLDAGTTLPKKRASGCGCRVVRASPSRAQLAASLPIALMLALRASRRRRVHA